MSTGGSFQLIVKDGPVDKIMMRSNDLNKLLAKLESQNHQVDSYVPVLNEVAEYFTVPIYSFFKPFVAVSMEYFKHNLSSGSQQFNSAQTFTLQQVGMFVTDMVLHVKTSSFKATNALDKVRWTAFPGHRMCEHTTFKINGNPIDDYYSEDYTAKFDFEVRHKRSWMRCVGQQLPYDGTLIADPSVDEVNEIRQFVNGPQTFKNEQPALDLWVPTLFWFNDPAFALPNGIIAHGQTEVTVDLADINDLVAFADLGGGGAFVPPTITQCELYVNNIYVNEELQNVFLSSTGASLIRVHRHSKNILQKAKDSIKLKDLRWSVERMYFAFRPHVNLSHSQQWHKMCVLTEVQVASSVVVEVPNPAGPVPPTILQLAGNFAIFYTESPSIDTLRLQSHGVDLFKEYPEAFFGNYMELQTGNADVTSPLSKGWYIINFNVTAPRDRYGWKAPSSYLNFSKAREGLLSYTSSYIGTTVTPPAPAVPYVAEVDFIVSAQAINFLKLMDESAVLSYST